MFTSLFGCMSAQVAAELGAEDGGQASTQQPGMGYAPLPMIMARGLPVNPHAHHMPVARPVRPQPLVMGRAVDTYKV